MLFNCVWKIKLNWHRGGQRKERVGMLDAENLGLLLKDGLVLEVKTRGGVLEIDVMDLIECLRD